MTIPTQAGAGQTNAAPLNSLTDRSFEQMLEEVRSQKTVQASVEVLLQGIGTIVKEGILDNADLDRALNKYMKPAFECVIQNTPSQQAHDTTGEGPVEVTGDVGKSYYDPQTTPGAVKGDSDAIPLDEADLDKHKGHKAKK